MPFRYHLIAVVVAVACLSDCSLNPAADFSDYYETGAVGRSFHEWTADWCPPLQVEVTGKGTTVYSYQYFCRRPNYDCVIYYEVADDKIISAWHKGSGCIMPY